jgi:hypothetical protein
VYIITNYYEDGSYDISIHGIDVNVKESALSKLEPKNYAEEFIEDLGDSAKFTLTSGDETILNKQWKEFNKRLSAHNVKPSDLINYPYIGIDTLEDLFKLLSGDASLLKEESDISNPHQFIITGNLGEPI